MVSQKVFFTSVACATLVAGVLGMCSKTDVSKLSDSRYSVVVIIVPGLLLGHFVVTPDKKGGRHALARTMPRLTEAQVKETLLDLIDAKEIERFLRCMTSYQSTFGILNDAVA